MKNVVRPTRALEAPDIKPVAHRSSAAPMTSSPDLAAQFRVVIGGTTLTGRLFDNATARDFASQLPMTLTFNDLHDVEKAAPLPRKLSVEGMPAGADPEVGDLQAVAARTGDFEATIKFIS